MARKKIKALKKAATKRTPVKRKRIDAIPNTAPIVADANVSLPEPSTKPWGEAGKALEGVKSPISPMCSPARPVRNCSATWAPT